MMGDKTKKIFNRIPIKFSDEGEENGNEPTPEEIGRESSYEDETEVTRRINRRDTDSDERDVAGGPNILDLPEHREDIDSRQAQGQTFMVGEPRKREEQDERDPEVILAQLYTARAELDSLKSENEKLRSDSASLLDTLKRSKADMENYRKRVDRDRADTHSRIVLDIATKLLPVIDNMRRALDAESAIEKSGSEEFSHFVKGIELIYKQLNDIIDGLGIEPVKSVGHPFDPHIHEAIATEHSDEHEPDTVTEEIVRGYRLGEKLLRPAMVKVSTR
jgi:molecular chaperone GrpE